MNKSKKTNNKMIKSPYWVPVGTIAAILAVIVGIFSIRGCPPHAAIRDAIRDAMLEELRETQRFLNDVVASDAHSWRLTVTQALIHEDKVPELFEDNPPLRKKFRLLYKYLNAGLQHAQELRLRYRESPKDEVAIKNLLGMIKEIIKAVDKAGINYTIPPEPVPAGPLFPNATDAQVIMR